MIPFHPFAEIFPLLEGPAFDELVEDIRVNGVREEIVLLDGKILDGRNRCRAAIAAGVMPEQLDQVDADRSWLFVEFRDLNADPGDPLAFVISRNLHRRHLSTSQRAMVAARLATMRQGERTDLPPSANLPNVSQGAAAAAAKVSERSTRTAKQVLELGTAELIQAVDSGATSVSTAAAIAVRPRDEQRALLEEIAASPEGKRAVRQVAKSLRAEEQRVRHEERQDRAERISAGNPDLPGRTWPLVLIDVPRKPNSYSDVTGSEKAPRYPTMTFRQLCDFPIDRFAAPDCILLFWSTAASYVDDLEILAEWGFTALRPRGPEGKLLRDPDGEPYPAIGSGRYASHQVWQKLRVGDALGMGRWFRDDHELLIAARRGDVPAPLAGTQARSVLEAPIGAHSEKPGDQVRAWIDRCWPKLSKVEVFARGVAPPGWTFWGNQAAPSTPEARAA